MNRFSHLYTQEHATYAYAKGANFHRIGISFGNLLQALPIFRSEGESVIAVNHLSYTFVFARLEANLGGGGSRVVGVLQQFAIERMLRGVAREDLVNERALVDLEAPVLLNVCRGGSGAKGVEAMILRCAVVHHHDGGIMEPGLVSMCCLFDALSLQQRKRSSDYA